MPTTANHRFIQPQLFRDHSRVLVAQSTRCGGYSEAPFASLNLSYYTPDNPHHVQQNRNLFFAELGFREAEVAGARQVHGADILPAKQPGQFEGYDALITQTPGLLLTVTIADCTPILIHDPEQLAIAAIHAGWRGTVAGIVSRTLDTMAKEFGTRPAHCLAFIGACIGAENYEVDADVADHFPDAFKTWDPGRQKFLLDMKGANRAQLLDQGIPASRIEVSPYCTVAHNNLFFSHRREKGRTGRMLGAIALR